MLVIIDVHENNIVRGARHDVQGCPVYKSLIGRIDANFDIYAGQCEIQFFKLHYNESLPRYWDHERVHSIKTPEKMKEFMIKFDNGEVVTPCEFTLDIPPQYLA